MSYNKEELPQFAKTAGRISILAALIGVGVFVFAWLVDVGNQELQKVSAQTATTSLTVLNTPPFFVQDASEVTESSTSTPTNSGDIIQWTAIGQDSNGAPYFLLVCSTNASPTANAAAGLGSLGTEPPECGAGAIQWGVSTSTNSGDRAFVSTTTTESADNPATQFSEINDWFAWVCDDDPVQPACVVVPTQGLAATNTSPFHMNQRPVLTDFYNDGGADPGATLGFFSTSSDPDTGGGEDTLTLIVCQDNTTFSSSTDNCGASQLATSTFNPTADATTTYTVASIVRDGLYPAYAYIIDNHGHEANVILQQDFQVNNVAPTIVGGDIDLNGGADIVLSVPGGETTGFTLDFTLSDANSCINASGATSTEITGFEATLFRSSFAAGCTPGSATYNPNNCYPSEVGTTTWNLSCTADEASCTGITDDTQVFNCTFPLWFLADPTDPAAETPAAFAADSWVAEIRGIDDNFATGTSATNTSQTVEVLQFAALNLLTPEIPYGALAPDEDSGTLSTTTTVENVGNTGLDQEVDGESMCGTFTVPTPCPVSASSTIPESEQKFASTTLSYTSGLAKVLSSSTPIEADLDVLKTTSTTTPNTGDTYWGIAVPDTITVAGSYQGLNTFYAVTASSSAWE